jgi:phage host-nuclease inhibitor protein Gam
MTKKPRIKLDAADHPVPQSLAEVNEAIAEIGTSQRERDRIQAEMNDNLAAVRAEYEAIAKPLAARIADLSKGIAMYCEANRDALTKGGKTKTARLATGEVSWRTRPPSVSVRGGARSEIVIAALRKLKLDRFLRIKTEIDKDAILADRAAVSMVKGITISQREEFVVKPFSTELEEVR